jgi:prevent-host-death family protein
MGTDDLRLTGDTLRHMEPAVTIRDLRNHGGDVVDRVAAGESLVVTRSGEPVAQLIPLRRRGLDAATLLARWRHLPPVDAARLRADLDEVLDPSL